MTQPLGIINANFPSYICKHKKDINGLNQAPRAWYQELREFLFHWDLFLHSHTCRSLGSTVMFSLHTSWYMLMI